MNLTKEEKNILGIERFLQQIKKDFDCIEEIYLFIPNIEDCKNYYKPKNKTFPLVVRIEHNGKSSRYDWTPHSSDDEYPIYNSNGEYFGYYDMKNYIEYHLPEAFKGKLFYKEERHLNANNIQELSNDIKNKLNVITLDKELKTNKSIQNRKFKL